MAKKLTDDDLIAILRREEQVGQNWQDAELLQIRQKALDYYDRTGSDFTSEEGQSSAVTSEFADTVESVMPGMMRVFAAGDEIGTFTPMEQADEQGAKEATQYVPHVLMRENDGYRIFYWFFKDVLMHRVATLTVDDVEVKKTKRESVEGWTQEQMAFRDTYEMENGATEVVWEVTQDERSLQQGGGGPVQAPDEPGWSPNGEVPGNSLGEVLGQPAATFSGTVTVTRKKKRVVVDNVAPEDLRVSPANTRDPDLASYLGYIKETTASELRVLGLSQEVIDSLGADQRSTPEEDQRQDGQSQSQPRKDDQRRLRLAVAYVKVDMDGDGISEMWRCVYAHAGGDSPSGALIEKKKWEDGEAPITLGSAILMPHTIVGRSLFDQTVDLQDQGTAITRGMLDNVYLTNRPRPIVNTKRVNILTVLDHTPGMPIQVDGPPGDAVTYSQVPSIIEPALAALGYLENKRDQRTGTSRLGNNMDSDALSDASRMTKGGTSMVLSAAQERQELMANTLAATAITRLMRHIYRAIKRCAEGPTKYYAKGEWQECDPTKWPDDMHLMVNVGTSNKQQEQMNLMGIGAAQEKIGLAQGGFNGPVVTLEHIANTGRKLAEASGYRGTSAFFASEKDIKQALEKQAMQPPQEPPEIQKEKAKTEGAIREQQAQLEGDIQKTRAEAEAEALKVREEFPAKQLEAQIEREKMDLEREKMALERDKMAHERAKLDHERAVMEHTAATAARDQAHEREMAVHKSNTQGEA